jgi:putative nucleotidyltransferase with HDIG domain
MTTVDREQAWNLLCQHTEKESLRKHALTVEAAMRHYAAKLGEDVELWGATGLLHDLDYERFPDEADHPYRGVEILAAAGYSEEMRQAVLGHAPYTGVPRETRLAKALFACDELSSFIVAVALIKPSKSIHDVDVRGVRKRLKEKAFARGVNREEVAQAVEEFGVELDDHIATLIDALKAQDQALGIAGVPTG